MGRQAARPVLSVGEQGSSLARSSFTKSSPTRSPLDMHVLRAVKRSPRGRDLYLWLTYRTFTLTSPLRLTWPKIYKQFRRGPGQVWR